MCMARNWEGETGREGDASMKVLFLLEVFEAGVQHLFHSAKPGAPGVLHIVDAPIHTLLEHQEHRSVEDYRGADRDIELDLGHNWSLCRASRRLQTLFRAYRESFFRCVIIMYHQTSDFP